MSLFGGYCHTRDFFHLYGNNRFFFTLDYVIENAGNFFKVRYCDTF